MEEILKFSPYEVIISYCEHKGVYESIEDYYDKEDFVDYDECIKKQQVIMVQVYPTTSISFYIVCASDYQTAVNKMCEILKKVRG